MPGTETEPTIDPQGVNRLLGMIVDEVSVVDRAANQRTFLLVKRGADGKVSLVKDDNAAQPALPGQGAPPAAKLEPMQAQVKDALLQAITGAAQKLVTLANQVKDAETTDQAATPPVPASITGEITECATMLSGLAAQYGGKQAADTPADPAAAPGAPPAAGVAAEPEKGASLGGITENGGQDEQGEQKRDAAAVGKALAVAVKATSATGVVTYKAAEARVLIAGFQALAKVHERIGKVGKKMAKERLERFRKAMDMLAGIMKELSADTMRKGAAPPSGVVLKATQAREMIAALEEAQKLVRTTEAEVLTLRKRVSTLERSPQAPNSHEPSLALATNTRAQPAAQAVAWPLDMNHDRAPKSAATDLTKPTPRRAAG